jgi:pyruvate dehydrogenase E1 component alpha subunit
LLLIRRFEETLLRLFDEGLLQGTTHTCLGQEYIPVALRTLLRPEDFVFSGHRGHGHYLARFEDPESLLAEIMGREGAVCGGVGGSQHILRDRYLSTGVQGESLPVAVGAGLTLKRTDPGAVCCVYIGDGSWGEGAVYEALNMACLWDVPLVVVVEHNGIAQSTPTHVQMAGSVEGRAAAFGADHHRVTTVDINRVRAELAPLFSLVRRTARPLVVEFATRRLGPHSRGDDTRPAEELERLRERDWATLYTEAFPDLFARADESARRTVGEVVAWVRAARPSTGEEPREAVC